MIRTLGGLALLVGISGCTPFLSTSDPNPQSDPPQTARAGAVLTRAASPNACADEPGKLPTGQTATPDERVNARPAWPAEAGPALGYQSSKSGPPAETLPPAPPSIPGKSSRGLEGIPLPPLPETGSATATPSTVPSGPPSRLPAMSPLVGQPAPPASTMASESAYAEARAIVVKHPAGQAPEASSKTGNGPADGPPGRGKVGLPLVRLVDTAVRVVRSRRITLNFALNDVGPSGVSTVELWYTQDGKDWTMCEAPPKSTPYVVEVDQEGKYGFTLLARSGAGLGKKRPGPGDDPQVWVIVDQTAPDVQLLETRPLKVNRGAALSIHWKASDTNFGRQPISLSYAERVEGPWHSVAAHLPNTGHYIWQAPSGLPNQFLIRVEATDLAGNMSQAQSPAPVVLDSSTPTVSIVAVEAGGR